MIALTAWLGRWQSDRAGEKEALQAMFEARSREAAVTLGPTSGPAEALLYRHVRATGRWFPEGQVFIDNRIDEGRAGFHVVTPLRLAGSERVVLVNRGWVERSGTYPQAPNVPPPAAGEVEVTGLAALPPKRYLELSNETVSGNVWQNLSLDRYAQRMKLDVLPVMILADRASPGLVPVQERPDTGIARHKEYSLTWYSLATTVLALWVFYSFRREPA